MSFTEFVKNPKKKIPKYLAWSFPKILCLSLGWYFKKKFYKNLGLIPNGPKLGWFLKGAIKGLLDFEKKLFEKSTGIACDVVKKKL